MPRSYVLRTDTTHDLSRLVRILGIDPGSRVTGFGVVEAQRSSLRYIDSGCIRTPGGTLAMRLKSIFDGIEAQINRHLPDTVAVERVFLARNPESALILGHARGSAICAAANSGMPVVEYSALQIKQAVVGRGRADKVQVQHMVRALLGLTALPPSDAADALACAICHINTASVEQKIQAQA